MLSTRLHRSARAIGRALHAPFTGPAKGLRRVTHAHGAGESGLGKLIVGALAQRDYTMLQGLMVIYTMIVVGVNMLTDVIYAFVDPRVRLQ